jgi:titin
VTAIRGNGVVTVTFTAPLNTGGSAISGYGVTVSPGGSVVTCPGSPCVVSGLINGTTYTFTAHATNVVGTSAESASSAAVTPATTPGAPGAFVVTGGDGAVALSFAPPAANGSAISGYEASTDGGTSWEPVTTTGVTPLVATVSGLVDGLSYEVEIRAVNGVGPGPGAGPDSTTPISLPGAPIDVSAVQGNGSAIVSFTAAGVSGPAVTSFTVTGSPGQRTVSCSMSPCVFPLLTNGTAYSFTVYATSPAGNSLPSTSSASVTPAGPPVAPGAPTAQLRGSSAVVSWVTPTDLNGAIVTGYTVISSPGGRTCTPTPADATTCVVTGLDPGVEYSFALVVHSTAGDSVIGGASVPIELVADLAFTGVSLVIPLTGGLALVLLGTMVTVLGERQRRRVLVPVRVRAPDPRP